MAIPVQYQPQSISIYSHQVQAIPNSNIDAEATCLAKKISEYKGEAPSLKEEKKSLGSRAWSSIKSIPRNISIFCRAVTKVLLIGYYVVKHKVFGVEFTSQHLKSYLQKLGPAYSKVLQSVGSDEELLNRLANFLGATESERKKFGGVVRDVLDNNPEIPARAARSILDKSGCQSYSVKSHIATGTIGSCFEAEKDEHLHVAKVIPDWKANEIAAGIKSMRMLFLFMPKTIKTTIRELTDPFMEECKLTEEKHNLTTFKEALEKIDHTETLDTYWVPQTTTLTFKVPSLTEDVEADNLLIMDKIHDGHTLNKLTNPDNRQLRAQVYQTCFGTHMIHDDAFLHALEQVHSQTKDKWREMALEHGIVHGDLHPGNIMLSFRSGGNIDVWFIDFGNCISLSDTQRQLYPEVVRLISSLTNPFTSEPINENNLEILTDILWAKIAISHKRNTAEDKQQFKENLRAKLIKLRDPKAAIDKSNALTSEKKEALKNNLDRPYVQNIVKLLILSITSATLSSICQTEGVQLPPSFTRYIASHFRAGVILE
ncbi:AarF/UbiB family protein [Endozoicomonas elysicola]|uniref:Protein kinase domain-containing protein n=1 Tax=Endozoicomonas elysicola TaxID=305900 RepID=A0A081KGJ8_9GAMM|nr:AarF/UbiB family protein [Endozoicomonas elysicola]KEI73274.1 hypothetical protein GV64_23435 [Endozoicomonas elysicola]